MKMTRIEEIKAKASAIEEMRKSPYISRDVKSLITYYYALEGYEHEPTMKLLKDNLIQTMKYMIEKLEQ